MKLVPLSDRVVLKQMEAEETTKSGIVLPGQNKEKPQQAEVVAVGPGGLVDGKEVVPLQVLKELLPDPASLGPRTVGKTNIGCIFIGKKDGKEKKLYIYNVCDHQECYKEVGSQAISYTTGVPAMIGAMMIMNGTWNKAGVYNIEEFDPDPFMEALNKYGLPWKISEDPELID